VRPVAPPVVERVFAGPATQLEAVVLAVRGLLEDVLEHRECGARRLELHLDRPDAGPLSVTITLSRPSRDARHLWSLLGPKIESVNLSLVAAGTEGGIDQPRLGRGAPAPGRLGPGPACP
jgi:hypothetical protein